MIKFGRPYVEINDSSATLKNTVEIDGKREILWFRVDIRYKDYLCYERGDAYLIAALNFAMRNHHDIEFDVPITGQLLFNIQNYLIPALIENNPSFYPPKIITEVSDEVLPNHGAVGTGISCGVDSLHALATKTNTCSKKLNITHLTFNNVGSHGRGEMARRLYKSRLEKPQLFAKEFGYEFVLSDSNLMDVIRQSHFKTHTYSSMFPVFCLQKLFSTYYYASGGYRFNEFSLEDLPTLCPGSYELLSLDTFSSPFLRIYSDGMGKSRLEKLSEVAKYPPSYKYLNVCLDDSDNCGKCEKCVRTLLGLDLLGVLDKYKSVFDIEYYKTNRKWYLQQMMYQIAKGKHDYFEMYPHFKRDISLSMRIKALPTKIRTVIIRRLHRYPSLYALIKKLLRR